MLCKWGPRGVRRGYHRAMTDAPRLPLLRGAKVWLRALEKADLTDVDLDDRDLGHFGGFRMPFAREAQERWYSSMVAGMGDTVYQFSICRLGDRRPIGGIGLRDIDRVNGSAEASIFIASRDDWGKGYGTDAMDALLDYAFGEMRLHRVYLHVFDYNPRAVRSYEKSGFVTEVRLRKNRFHRGAHHDEFLMAILRADWERLDRPRCWQYDEVPTPA